MKISRNILCPCGSGLKYKHCHYKINTAPPGEGAQAAKKVYSNQWKANARWFEAQGYYDWMASIVAKFNPKSILDIGCGDGSGLMALMNKVGHGVRLVSIDENEECIRLAKDRLGKEKIPLSVVNRIQTHGDTDTLYALAVEEGSIQVENNVALLASDILLDEDIDLFNFLSQEKFDAMTVWLIGTHMARKDCFNISNLNIKANGEYRLRVQNKAYELADKILNKGGILSVVDRCEVPDTEQKKNDVLKAHEEQASVTNLKVEFLDYITYREPNTSSRVVMRETLGTSGARSSSTGRAMVSVVSIKP